MLGGAFTKVDCNTAKRRKIEAPYAFVEVEAHDNGWSLAMGEGLFVVVFDYLCEHMRVVLSNSCRCLRRGKSWRPRLLLSRHGTITSFIVKS